LNSIKSLKKKLTPMLSSSSSKKTQRDRMVPNSFYEANIILISKLGKDEKERVL
jgi:hypothetical protein